MFSITTKPGKTRVLCLLLLACVAGARAEQPVPIEPQPAWVLSHNVELAADVPHATIANGVYDLLVDTQVRVPEDAGPEYFFHYAQHVLNQTGVEGNSQITINFDPVYESLVLHDVSVWRDGRQTGKLETARISLINREEELDNLLYSGEKTLHLILDDIRVGDIIEYSFSINGDNPIYNGIFAHRRSLNWTVPVHQLSLALHWQKSAPLHHQFLNSNLKLDSRETPQGMLYRLDLHNVEPLTEDEDIPHWFNPYSSVYFSETNGWEAVASWARPLMESGVERNDAIKKIAARIRKKHREPAMQIAAALQYVQDEIRYFGIEIGENSHRPANAGVTLARRYGDCKDKTVLLLSILRELGIEAYAALVNSRVEKEINNIIPSARLFDHVIAAVMHQGETYWLDPTRQYQYGDLHAVYQPDFGYALVLSPNAAALTAMEPQQAPLGSEIHEVFDLSAGKDEPVTYTTHTRAFGLNAENIRRRLAGRGRKTIEDEYLSFYKDYYSRIESTGAIEFTDYPERNEVVTEEQYSIKDMWELSNEDNNFYTWFYPNSLSHHLKAPKQQQRKHPLAIAHPINSRHVIELKLDSQNWHFDDEDFSEDNPFFSYSSKFRFNKKEKTLTLEYAYRSKTDHVPAESFNDYYEAVKRTDDQISYGIYSSFTATAEPAGEDHDYGLYIWLACLAMFIVIIALWRIDATRRPFQGETLYFPVSLPKFLAMWFLTFGLYGVYWFYKNWYYVKQRDQSGIMPAARGIFSQFWYYPLYAELRKDSLQRFGKPQLPPLAVGALVAIVFLALFVAAALSNYGLMFSGVAALLLLPLVNYVNYAGGDNSAAFRHNSRWTFRHYLLILLATPLLLLMLGVETGLLPSDSVIQGKKLLSHDIKFLQRKGAIAPGDEIVYFYSDAFLSNRNDGNGFSDRHVFSYWVEDDNFNLQTAEFDDIKDIQINWGGWNSNTTLEVIRQDDSKFILYAGKKDKVFVDALLARWDKKPSLPPHHLAGEGALR